MAAQGIQVFTSLDPGAPVMSGQIGAMIALLDACLINGYNSVGITGITRSGTTATATSSGAHGLQDGDWTTVSGAVETAYNGKVKITYIDSTHFNYTVAGSPSTPATGTISQKRAGAGYTKAYTGTNLAAYQSGRADSLKHYFRVDDTVALSSRAVAYESMSDVNTGSNAYPSTAQQSGGGYMHKSSAASSSPRPWVLITNGKIFYLFVWTSNATDTAVPPSTVTSYVNVSAFGDFIPYNSGDMYSSMCAVTSATTYSGTNYGNPFYAPSVGFNGQSTYGANSYAAARSIDGATISALLSTTSLSGLAGSQMGLASANFDVTTGYMALFLPFQIIQGQKWARGRVPGALESMMGPVLPQWQRKVKLTGYTGREFMSILLNAPGAANQGNGQFLMDLTGSGDDWD